MQQRLSTFPRQSLQPYKYTLYCSGMEIEAAMPSTIKPFQWISGMIAVFSWIVIEKWQPRVRETAQNPRHNNHQ